MIRTKFVKTDKTKIFSFKNLYFFSKNRAVCKIKWKNMLETDRQTDRLQMTIQYGTYALHAMYLTLQTHTQNMLYLLFFHCNRCCMNKTQCYVYTHIACLANSTSSFSTRTLLRKGRKKNK